MLTNERTLGKNVAAQFRPKGCGVKFVTLASHWNIIGEITSEICDPDRYMYHFYHRPRN